MKGVFLGLFVLCALLMAVCMPKEVFASEWGSGTPVIYRDEPVNATIHPDCPAYQQELTVEGVADKQMLCVFDGGPLRLATFFADGIGPMVAIAFPLDAHFYVLDGVCTGVGGCQYSADADTLAARFMASSLYTGTRVFKHVQQRIHRYFDGSAGVMKYWFDSTAPDLDIKNGADHVLAIGAMAFSENGRWLAIELQNSGIALVNVETGVVRQVFAPGAQYGRGFDPREELAVSNDGSLVAVMGENAGLSLIQVRADCGEDLAATLDVASMDPSLICPTVPTNTSELTDRFVFASAPSFSQASDRMNFIVVSRGSGPKRVSLIPQNYTPVPSLEYMALGDSFTSGEGETDDRWYLSGTNDTNEKCHVSGRSYPFLLAKLFLIPDSLVRSVACSGATTSDVTGNAQDYWGQDSRLGGLSLAQKQRAQDIALHAFYPGRIKQSIFVAENEPRFVTLGIGGNDAGFMDKLKTCAMPGTCEWAAPEVLGRVKSEIETLFDTLVMTYRSLQNASPLTKLIAVGYPKTVQPDGTCDPVTAFLLNQSERVFMNEGVRAINRVIRRAAMSVGIGYLDIEDAFLGRELCSGSSSPAMNGLRVGDDVAIGSIPLLKILGAETFHPTPFGHELIARAVKAQYPTLFSGSCCQVGNTEAVVSTNYWPEKESNIAEASLQGVDFLTSSRILTTDASLQINLGALSVQPDTAVRVEVHSDSATLGSLVADSSGAVSGEVAIPDRIEAGYHTAHLFVTSFSGNAVDLYQVFLYTDPSTEAPGSSVLSRGDMGNVTPGTVPSVPGVLGASSGYTKDTIIGVAQSNQSSNQKPATQAGIVFIVVSICTVALICTIALGCLSVAKHSQDRGG